MAIFLLDTTLIVDAINSKRGRAEFLDQLLEQRNLLACCSINVTEVYAGMRLHEGQGDRGVVAESPILRSDLGHCPTRR